MLATYFAAIYTYDIIIFHYQLDFEWLDELIKQYYIVYSRRRGLVGVGCIGDYGQRAWNEGFFLLNKGIWALKHC